MANSYTEFLKAIANEDRLMMLVMIKQYQEGLTPSQICQHFYLEYPTVNHHLQEMVKVEILKISHRGRQVMYQINIEKLEPIIQELGWILLQALEINKEVPKHALCISHK